MIIKVKENYKEINKCNVHKVAKKPQVPLFQRLFMFFWFFLRVLK